MEFSCRPGVAHKTWLYRLNGQTLELLNENNEVKRAVELGKIRRIQQYAGFATKDPETGSYDSEYCKIVPARGPSVYLRNGSYVQPSGKIGEFVANKDDEYVAFLTELKRRVVTQNPKVPIIYGWMAASIVWWGLLPLGICFLAFAIGGFMVDDLLTALFIAAFFVPCGCMLVTVGPAMGRAYWPRRTTIAKDLETLAPEPSLPPETIEVAK